MWDFDDGKYLYLEQPSDHIYSNKSDLTVPHDIHLEATTQYGCYDDTIITVSVYPYVYEANSRLTGPKYVLMNCVHN